MTKGGQSVQYTTKERTQCMENDRFLVTKKVNLANLPDPGKQQAQVVENSLKSTTIERSAQEVHDAYLAKIAEMKVKRKQEEEARRLAEQ